MARKTEFELETAAGMDILPVPDCKISINGQAPNDSPYASIDIKGKYYFIKDRDLERFAVNVLKALNSKKLKQ